MRKTKVKEIRKLVVTAFAMFALATGTAFAHEVSVDNWDDALVEVQKEGVTKLILDVSQHSDPLMDTVGSSMNITSPPVPGNGIVIEGRMESGHSGYYTTLVGNGSQILNNSAKTTVNNVSFKSGSVADANGGAIVNTGDLTLENTDLDTLSEISSNKAIGDGGAIDNSGTLTIKNYIISNNEAQRDPDNSNEGGIGGAIYNTGTLTVDNTRFNNNTANNYGGAIANWKGNATISSSIFTGNKAVGSSQGGAILNASTMDIHNSIFTSNSSGNLGGAITNGLGTSADDDLTQTSDVVLNIYGTTSFNQNNGDIGAGAINNHGTMNSGVTNIVNIHSGARFVGNTAKMVNGEGQTSWNSGGAIVNSGALRQTTYDPDDNPIYTVGNDGVLNIFGTADGAVLFKDNLAGSGGAIKNEGIADINYAIFEGNGYDSANSTVITTNGGAIYNTSGSYSSADLTVKNTSFTNNQASQGGAIYNESGTVRILDSSFVGNVAGQGNNERGGAIYGDAGSTTVVRAHDSNMTVGYYNDATDNSVANNHDSIVFSSSAIGELQAAKDKTLTIYSKVYGSGGDKAILNINSDYIDASGASFESEGTVRISGDADIRCSRIVLNNGELAFDKDSALGTVGLDADQRNDLTLNGGTLNLLNNHLSPDNKYTNQLVVGNFILNNDTNIKLDVDLKKTEMDNLLASNVSGNITVDPDTTPMLLVSGMKSISDTDKSSVDILFTDIADLEGHVGLADDFSGTVEGPIYQYAVQHLSVSHTGGGGAAATVDPGEYFRFNRIGNSNSVIAGPVAAQAAFLLMDNIYRQSFANMDMVTLMTPEQRMAWKMRNKYANADLLHRGVYAPNIIPEERDGWYLRPFTNFENVPLKNGPKVSNVFYGTLIGGESDIIDLGHGWDGNFSFFGAYHGSHQAYNGNSIWQNGGSIGGVATAYKGNFFTGVTANVGASAARATHAFGSEDFPILMTGAAWKSGYNWGLLNNKLVIQPSYMMSYTFVNVFDYTNAAGVNITQDPLHAIEFIPGIKIIGNLPNGWQPYAALNMTWIAMDRTKFYANDVALTRLGIKPFVEYGVGLQKRYGDRFTGFGQAMIRNGGRNGIAFTLGFRWALGN